MWLVYRHNRRIFFSERLKLANRLPRHTPFRERLIETSEAYMCLLAPKCRSSAPLFCRFRSFLILGSILLRCSGRACASLVHRHDQDHGRLLPALFSTITPGGVGFRESLFEILLRDLCKVPGEVAVLISAARFFLLRSFWIGRRYLLSLLFSQRPCSLARKCRAKWNEFTAVAPI